MTTIPLRRVARVVNGGTPTPAEENWGGEQVWATPVDLGKVDGGHLVATDRSLTLRGLATGSATVPPGSLLLSTRAPIGYIARVLQPTAFNQGCKGIVPNTERVDARFLQAQLLAAREMLQAAGSGSTFLELSNEALLAFPVHVPSIDVQRQVAEFLDGQCDRIDSIISLRENQISALTEVLDAFVNEVAVPTALGGGADDALFEDRRLRSVCRFFTDGDWIESPYITDHGIRLIQTGNVGVGVYKEQGYRYVSTETFQALRCTEVLPGDLLISRLSPPVARACIAPDLGCPMIASVDVVIARPVPDVSADYLAVAMSSTNHLASADLLARGSTMLRLSRSQVASLRIPLPEPRAQARIVGEVTEKRSALTRAAESMREQVDLLRERKRSLITAAVTGEFDVTTAGGRGVVA